MKVVTWNCNGAFRNKYHYLEQLEADILVIQECEDPARSTRKYTSWAGDHLWFGTSKLANIPVYRSILEIFKVS